MKFKEIIEKYGTDREITFSKIFKDIDMSDSPTEFNPECDIMIIENHLYLFDKIGNVLAIIM